MTSKRINQSYHISTDNIISIRGLIELICKKMNVDFEKVVDLALERPGKDAAYCLDNSKMLEEFNWAPKISLDEGLNHCIHWAKGNVEILAKQNFEYVHKS